MVQRRFRRPAPSLGRLPRAVSKQERLLIPQLLDLLRSGALTSLLSNVATPAISNSTQATSAVTPPSFKKQNAPKPTPVAPQNAGWTEVKNTRNPPDSKHDNLLQEGWSVPVKTSIADLHIGECGVCLVSTSQARKALPELKSEKALAVLSPMVINGIGEEIHVMVEDASGRWHVRRRFLLQLGAENHLFERCAQKDVCSRHSKSCVELCRMPHRGGSLDACINERAGINKTVSSNASKVSFLDVRPPTRVAGAPDMLQVIVFLPSSAWIQVLRASGTDGVFVRPFFENDQDKNLYRVVPMPSSSSLAASIRQAQFFGETAFGVMPYANGYGIRVKSEDFENVLLQIHPEDADQFLGKKLEISGLPLAMGKESLQSFFGNWRVRPLYTFRQGFQRTLIIRSTQEPTEKFVAHDFGVAVIKEATQRRTPPSMERFRAPRPDHTVSPAARAAKPMHAPKSWVSVVVGDSGGAKAGVTKPAVGEGVVPAVAAASRQAVSMPVPVASTSAVRPLQSAPPIPQTAPNSDDLMQVMAAAIEAALKPMRQQLEATIVPMQRTLESLQAEFISFREFQGVDDDDMPDAVAAALREPKRPGDADRVQTRATKLRISGQAA